MMHFNLLDTRAGQDIYHIGLHEGENKGIVKGKIKGIAEGEKKREQEIAKTLLFKKFDVMSIIEITNLTKADVIALKSKI
ncbi:MAG: hypothetical protein VSS52_009770 [Thiotrichaceae bacterium]|nr:hypothetical protein [Thiotrichaceae bacterium]